MLTTEHLGDRPSMTPFLRCRVVLYAGARDNRPLALCSGDLSSSTVVASLEHSRSLGKLLMRKAGCQGHYQEPWGTWWSTVGREHVPE